MSPLEVGDAAVRKLLDEVDLVHVEHLTVLDFKDRYAPVRPSGKLFGHLRDERVGGYVVAERKKSRSDTGTACRDVSA